MGPGNEDKWEETNIDLINVYQRNAHVTKSSCPGGVRSNGLYWEVVPERGTFFRL